MKVIGYLLMALFLLSTVSATGLVVNKDYVPAKTHGYCINGNLVIYGKLIGKCSSCNPLFVKPVNYNIDFRYRGSLTRYSAVAYSKDYLSTKYLYLRCPYAKFDINSEGFIC